MYKNFNNWFEYWIIRRWREQGVVLLDDALERASDNSMDDSAEAAWDYQQIKLNEANKLLKEILTKETAYLELCDEGFDDSESDIKHVEHVETEHLVHKLRKYFEKV